MENKWCCKACQWEGNERDIETKLYFAQTQEEPAEYTAHCPSCNSTRIEEIIQIMCQGCEDEPVKDEGDYCSECYSEECERYADAARGH